MPRRVSASVRATFATAADCSLLARVMSATCWATFRVAVVSSAPARACSAMPLLVCSVFRRIVSVADVFAWTLVLVALLFLLEGIIAKVEHRMLRWRT